MGVKVKIICKTLNGCTWRIICTPNRCIYSSILLYLNTVTCYFIMKKRNHLKDLGIDGGIMLKLNWIHLDQNRDQWRSLVNTVMNLRVSWKTNFLTIWVTLGSSRTLLHAVSYMCPSILFTRVILNQKYKSSKSGNSGDINVFCVSKECIWHAV